MITAIWDKPNKIFKEITMSNALTPTIGMWIRERRKAGEEEPYRQIVEIDDTHVHLFNPETERRTKAQKARLDRYEIDPDRLPKETSTVTKTDAQPKGDITSNTVVMNRNLADQRAEVLRSASVVIHPSGDVIKDRDGESGRYASNDEIRSAYPIMSAEDADAWLESRRERALAIGASRRAGQPPAGLFATGGIVVGYDFKNASFLDDVKIEIRARLDQLQAQVDEHAQLTAALRALEGRLEPAAGAPRRGRPRGSGTRAKEAIAEVTKSPGITTTEIAERMGINQNYLYRVLPALEQDGKLEKRGRGWYLPGQVR